MGILVIVFGVVLFSLLFVVQQIQLLVPVSVDPLNQAAADATSSFVQTSTSSTHLAKKRRRPFFNDTGIVLFYHLPKTGGTSVRKFFTHLQSRSNLPPSNQTFRFRRISNFMEESTRRDGAGAYQAMEDVLGQRQRAILLIELHGNIPGLPVLHSDIVRWRTQAATNNIPLFFFLLLREPVSFYVSYFVHFHRPGCRYHWCEKKKYALTEAKLRQSAFPNAQCHMLYYGQSERKRLGWRKSMINESQCLALDDLLVNDWDWVGVADDLDSVLFPGLLQLLTHPKRESPGMVPPPHQLQKEYRTFGLHSLGNGTVQALLDLARYDVELLDRIQQMDFYDFDSL